MKIKEKLWVKLNLTSRNFPEPITCKRGEDRTGMPDSPHL
jgi:hypothetical protein